MTLLSKVIARLVGMLWTLALALLGLGVAMYCFDGFIKLHKARPDRLLHFPSVHRHVGHFLTQVAAPGATAGLALLCGVGAVLIGLLLMRGLFSASRTRQAVLDNDRSEGRLAARPRALREVVRALAEQADGPAAVDRPRLRLSRRGTRGRLMVSAARPREIPEKEVREALEREVAPISEAFSLRTQVQVRVGERGQRVT